MIEYDPKSDGPEDALGDGVPGSDLQSARAELARAHRELEECHERARAADEREEQLRHELQHRVRNTLSLIRSVFVRTVAASESIDDLDAHFSGRLDVLAAHQLTDALGYADRVGLETLLRDELRSFAFGDLPGITIHGPDVTLAPDHVQPMALAFHELVTNALKFGALAVEGAALTVAWTLTADVLELTWLEAGVPVVVAAPQRRGFSREFIEDGLPYQVGAETHFELRPGGVFCRIRLPIPKDGRFAATKEPVPHSDH